ncbi:hypothetical protein [Amycolatopsis thermoflava]|uniref:hypothetical protein n=1 Tax=Amycolatopsis thermoflava TaxID=84480 RepID=UPI003D74BFBD
MLTLDPLAVVRLHAVERVPQPVSPPWKASSRRIHSAATSRPSAEAGGDPGLDGPLHAGDQVLPPPLDVLLLAEPRSALGQLRRLGSAEGLLHRLVHRGHLPDQSQAAGDACRSVDGRRHRGEVRPERAHRASSPTLENLPFTHFPQRLCAGVDDAGT